MEGVAKDALTGTIERTTEESEVEREQRVEIPPFKGYDLLFLYPESRRKARNCVSSVGPTRCQEL